MAIPRSSCYQYQTVVHADRHGEYSGIAEDDGGPSLVGSSPSVAVTNGRVTMTRRSREILKRSSVATVSFDGGEALAAVLRQGDRLGCWRTGTAEIGVSVTRAGSLVLALGALGRAPGGDITIEHDPRVEETELAREVRYLDRPGTHIVWLDPTKPRDLEAGLRELDGGLAVKVLAIVVRTDDPKVSRDLNHRTMGRFRPHVGGTLFLTAAERFSSAEDWLQYARALSTDRPRDLWLRIRSGSRECLVPEGRTDTVDGLLVHVLRVYEPGLPGRLSQVGLVRADTGVTAAMLERSTIAVANGLTY